MTRLGADLGTRYGELVVTGDAGTASDGKPLVFVRCSCGTEKSVRLAVLRRGATVSCGCLSRKHRMSKSRVYNIWQQMHQRCGNPNYTQYKDYGGRGIEVCERWSTFENFYEDMGNPPLGDMTLDRVDVDGSYSKENCRWLSKGLQGANRRCGVAVDWFGRKVNLSVVLNEVGCKLKRSVVADRMQRLGMSVYDAMWTPLFFRNEKAPI